MSDELEQIQADIACCGHHHDRPEIKGEYGCEFCLDWEDADTLLSENDALQAELESEKKQRSNACAAVVAAVVIAQEWIAEKDAKIDALKAQRDELADYAQHKPDCLLSASLGTIHECTCGLDKALAAIGGDDE